MGAHRRAGGGCCSAGCCRQPARADRDRGRRRAAAAARACARARYPRGGGVHLRLWTAERLAELSGATNLAGSWLDALRPRAGREDRPGRRPALAAAGDRHAQARPRAPPSSPRSTCPATGSTATAAHRHGSGSAPEPWSAPAAPCCPAPGSASGPRSRPARASPGRCRPGSAGPACPAAGSGKAAHRWPDRRPPRAARWTVVYGLTSLALGFLPVAAALPGLLVLGRSLRRCGDAAGRAPARPCSAHRWRR